MSAPGIFESNDDNGDYYTWGKKMTHKKSKYMDEDKDGLNDYDEMKSGRHDSNNKPLHLNIGGSLPRRGSIIAIHHQGVHMNGKMNLKVNMTSPKMNVKMKLPEINMKMKKISAPKAKLNDERIIKPNNLFFDESIIRGKFGEIVVKKRKRKTGLFGLTL